MQLDGLWDGDSGDFAMNFTRQEFDKLMEPYAKQAMDTVKKVLRDAKMKPEQIHELVMVGGSTRVPKLQGELSEFFGGKELCKAVNPDECVAYGAAVQGAILSGERSDKTSALLLVDVTPLSLGVEVEGKAMSVIVKRNTPVPCSKKSMYTTCEDFQTSIGTPPHAWSLLQLQCGYSLLFASEAGALMNEILNINSLHSDQIWPQSVNPDANFTLSSDEISRCNVYFARVLCQ